MILVVEDDVDLLRLLERELVAANHRVLVATNGAGALERARRHHPALVLLDVNLPDIDGIEVLRRLKQSPGTARAAVVLLSGRAGESDRIVGLELGADDYIAKPFSLRELLLRVQAVYRRVADFDSERAARRVGRIEIDPAAFVVRVDGARVSLTVTEFRLLEVLSEGGGRVCTRAELEARAGRGQHVPDSRVLQTHMRRLKRKLGEAGAQIETVRAVGYRLRVDQHSR
jgi:two-component system phosphate regulon response regulator PhoB